MHFFSNNTIGALTLAYSFNGTRSTLELAAGTTSGGLNVDTLAADTASLVVAGAVSYTGDGPLYDRAGRVVRNVPPSQTTPDPTPETPPSLVTEEQGDARYVRAEEIATVLPAF